MAAPNTSSSSSAMSMPAAGLLSKPNPNIRKIRRSTTADPLVRPKPKKPPPKRPLGAVPPGSKPTVHDQPEPDDDPSTYSEYKLMTTKKLLLRNIRHHCMRLTSKNTVNITDSNEFIRPIKLHRRDPRAPLQGAKLDPSHEQSLPDPDEKEIDPEEKAKKEAEKAEKERQHQENLAKIAPHGGAVKQKKNMFKKKTQQVFQRDEEERKLRYEEFFPWFIEDYENKNTWVGNLEGALSGTSVMLVMDEGMFKMIPIEKFYRFQQRNTYKTLTSEQAEAVIKQKKRLERWFMDVTKSEEKEAKAKEDKERERATKRLYTVKGDRLEGRDGKPGFTDADELDFEEDFADDEETPIIEGDDEELKAVTKKMKQEQLSANIFDIRNEKDYEKEEKEKEELERSRKAQGRKVKKYLKQREKNHAYESDSDENPYASSHESIDSDEEAAQKEEEERKKAAEKAAREKEEEEKKKERQVQKETDEAVKSLKAAIAASQPGTSTTPGKSVDEPAKSLKRSGSPGAADSATELGHPNKRMKKEENGKQAPPGAKLPSRLISGKRDVEAPNPTAPASETPKPKKRRKPTGAGSGSEYETGGEMSEGTTSDAGKAAKKLKLRVGGDTTAAGISTSRQASPPAVKSGIGKKSRSGSPSAGTSRAGSPGAASDKSKVVTEEEIKAVLTPEGIDFATISRRFHGRVNGSNKAEFFKKLKGLSRLVDDKDRGKVFYPREDAVGASGN